MESPGTRFVVFGAQRSGSTWLVSLLNQVEGTNAYGELFLQRKHEPEGENWDAGFAYPRFVESEARGLPLRPLAVFRYLNQLYQPGQATGFKLMYSQLEKLPEIKLYLYLRHVKVIHLVRRNHLDAELSRMIKRKLQRSHVRNGEALPEVPEVLVDPKLLLGKLTRRSQQVHSARRLLRRWKLDHMETAYEDLQANPSCFLSILDALQVSRPASTPTSNFVKINRRSHREIIENYSEVQQALQGTAFAALLE